MKNLSGFSKLESFKAVKEELIKLDDYCSYVYENKQSYIKISDMADIALWDNTENKIVMCHGWDYKLTNYPIERYIPIGIEVIPQSHMDDGHARIISLRYMSSYSPMTGSGSADGLLWGLGGNEIEGLEYKTYVPSIKEIGATEFAQEQTIAYWETAMPNTNGPFPSDLYSVYPNPYTDKQGYIEYDPSASYFPSPFDAEMNKNPIFFTENPDSGNPSMLLDFDGKTHTANILKKLDENLGGKFDWRSAEHIPTNVGSDSGITLTYDDIAPAAQCCYRYCLDESLKDNPTIGEGQWYLPTIGELIYAFARCKAINNSIKQINKMIPSDYFGISSSSNSYAIPLDTLMVYWSCSCPVSEDAFALGFGGGGVGARERGGSVTRGNVSYGPVRAFCLV